MRKFSIIMIVALLSLFLVVPAQAASPSDVPIVTAGFREPDIGYFSDSGIYYYGAIFGVYNGSVYKLYYIKLSSSSSFTITGFTPTVYPGRIPTLYFDGVQSLAFSVYTLNINSGAVIESHSETVTSPFKTVVYPNGDGTVPYTDGLFFYKDGVNVFPIASYKGYNSKYGGYATDIEFITFPLQPLDVRYYTSYCSEPVCDDLNRYFILAGEDQSYLYAVRYHIQQYSVLLDTIINNQFSFFFLENFIAPQLELSDSGLSLSLYSDPTWLSAVDASQITTLLSYDIHIAQYDLATGQYVASFLFDDLNLGDNEIALNIDLGNAADYDSVQVYGVYYKDICTKFHYNYLACVWGQDPSFLYWQEQVVYYLDEIYELLNQQGEDVTIDQDMSAINEGESAKDALKVTDEYGSEVDAAQQVEVAFSEAAQGFGELGDSVTGINGLIQQIFFRYPIIVLPVIVALALGLLVTILGKNKSD